MSIFCLLFLCVFVFCVFLFCLLFCGGFCLFIVFVGFVVLFCVFVCLLFFVVVFIVLLPSVVAVFWGFYSTFLPEFSNAISSYLDELTEINVLATGNVTIHL